MTHDLTSLRSDLLHLPLRARVLIVHASYKALGAVEGGPDTVLAALSEAVGPEGTLLMPAFTTDLIDPATWPTPPAPAERLRLLQTIPYFDPAVSVPYKMGALSVALWRSEGALRSHHPVTSWTARGPHAEALLRDHPLDDPEGANSPIGRAWRADAAVMLIGVDHDTDTTIHLAESLLDMPHLRTLPDHFPERSPDGSRDWRPVAKTTKCSDGFVAIEPLLSPVTTRLTLGDATVKVLRSRDVVRLAGGLFRVDPPALLCGDPTCVHCPTSRAALATWVPPAAPVEVLP